MNVNIIAWAAISTVAGIIVGITDFTHGFGSVESVAWTGTFLASLSLWKHAERAPR